MSLSSALRRRRCETELGCQQLKASLLSEMLSAAHGHTGEHGRGPTPSAGGLQSIELYLASLSDGWLAPGYYHYDRPGHCLSQISSGADRIAIEQDWLPSLLTVSGGSLLWIIVGDADRARKKYGDRAVNFLGLEAGHLMQRLCLLSTSVGAVTVPLGGFYEEQLAEELQLPRGDIPLYVGIAGHSTR
ncbi:MAG: SagB/ThcOx family dehydrogenase [Myxococcales bacterium]|nr:SagB/ThcOx family dehydrogenase [Myxococcales bacterium]